MKISVEILALDLNNRLGCQSTIFRANSMDFGRDY